MQVFIPVIFLATFTVGEALGSKFSGPTALPVVLHSGYLADTHEVAAAKNAHLATLSHQFQGDSHYTQHGNHGDLGYYGYSTLPQVQHDGHIADNHEVAAAKAEYFAAKAEHFAAKAEHFAAVAKARSLGAYPHGGDYSSQYNYNSGATGAHHEYGSHSSYNGPLAKPVVLPSGYLADTVEVANARQQHFHVVHSSQSKHLY